MSRVGVGWIALCVACGPTLGSADGDDGSGDATASADATGRDASGPGASDEGPRSTSTSGPTPGDVSTSDDGPVPVDEGPVATDDGPPPPPAELSRLLIFYTPHGYWADHGWGETLGQMLQPLAGWHDDLMFVEGIANVGVDPEGIDVMDAHSTASAALLTGGLLGSGILEGDDFYNPHFAGGPSIDVVLGDALGAGVPVASVHLGVRAGPEALPLGVSYVGADQPRPPYVDPGAAFDAIFGGVAPDPSIDALGEQVHGIDGSDPSAVLDGHVALAHGIFAHDLSRVQLLTVDVGVPHLHWTVFGWPQTWHDVLMQEPAANVADVYAYWGESLADLVGQLESTPAPEAPSATLLDTTLVVWLSEMGPQPQAHSRSSILCVILDRSGTFQTGASIEVPPGSDTADLAATLAVALGVELGPFGHPSLGADALDTLFAP